MTTVWRLTRSVMEARLHYSRTLLLLAPTANPSPAPAAPGIPDARPAAADAGRAFTWLNTNAIVALALLICGVVAAIALHVALQCALRATRRVCYGAGDALHEPPRAGGGRAPGQSPRHGGGRKRGALVQALPCVAYSAGLELTGSSRSECAICLGQFALGEPVRVLPRCNHGFHARCIDRWLAARPTCPTCRQAPFAEPEHVLADRAGPAVVPVVRVMVDDGASLRVEL